MSEKRPWIKFYPADWRADPKLRMCGLAARGLWLEMLGLMHEAEPYGHLLVNAVSPSPKQIGSFIGAPEREVNKLLAELEQADVFSRTDGGVIYSRRMVRDKAKAERDRENGKGGGNPKLKGWVNPNTKGGDKAQKPEARDQKLEEAASAASAAPPKRAPGDLLGEAVMEACGLDPARTLWAFTEADSWLAGGWGPEFVLRVVRDVIRRQRSSNPAWKPKGLSYFTPALIEAAQKAAAPTGPNGAHHPAADPAEAARRYTAQWAPQQWDAMVKKFRETDGTYWHSKAGEKPGHKDCIAPRDLLAKHGYGSAHEGSSAA